MPPTRAWRSCAGYPRAGDRSPAYTEAATNAAPEAVQVADRWHLVKNLAEAVTRFLDQHRADLRRAAPLLDSGGSGEGSLPVLPVVWPPTKGAAEDEYRQRQRGKRQRRYEIVLALHEQGMSQRKIAGTLGLARGTVRRYVQAGSFPEVVRKVSATSLDPFKPYLRRHWLEGCQNASLLFREIQKQGFAGTCSWVMRYVAGLRRGMATAVTCRPCKPPASRTVTALLLRRPEELRPGEAAFVSHLRQTSPRMQSVCDLAGRFLSLLRQRGKSALSALSGWREDALRSGASAMAGFATGLGQDLRAVEAALSLSWSNAQSEGQVNRLKLVKRQMYGRAGFALLKARVLPLPS